MLLFASIANQFPRPTLSDPKNQSQDFNRPFESTLGISRRLPGPPLPLKHSSDFIHVQVWPKSGVDANGQR
jgi:hypothetical protein